MPYEVINGVLTEISQERADAIAARFQRSNAEKVRELKQQVMEELRYLASIADLIPQADRAAWVTYRQELLQNIRATWQARDPDAFVWPNRPGDPEEAIFGQ